MEKWRLALVDYKDGMKYQDIANKHDVSINTVKSWKSRHWNKEIKNKGAPTESVHTKEKVAHKEVMMQLNANEELNDKQKLFCLYRLKYFNSTKAYQKAYGCSYATAMVEGSRLLRNPKIKQEIDRLKLELFSDTYIDSKAVLQKMIDIAFADIGDYLEFGREIKEVKDGSKIEVNSVRLKESMDLDTSLITEVKEGREGVSIKLADKMKALDFLSKYEDRLTVDEKSKLQKEKLRLEVQKAQRELDEMTGKEAEQVIFVDSTAEMEAYLAKHGDSNGEG